MYIIVVFVTLCEKKISHLLDENSYICEYTKIRKKLKLKKLKLYKTVRLYKIFNQNYKVTNKFRLIRSSRRFYSEVFFRMTFVQLFARSFFMLPS